MTKVLVTCPPMIKQIKKYRRRFKNNGMTVTCPPIVQTLTERELIKIVPEYDVWIIGDDPATKKVFKAGKKGNLKVAIKWGVGIDNVDFAAAFECGIKVQHTPGMFGDEVADIAVAYIISLARDLHIIDRGVREGEWPKPCGISLRNKKLCLVGFGDIGQNIALRLIPFGVDIWVSDPQYKKIDDQIKCLYNEKEVPEEIHDVRINSLEKCLRNAHFVVVACALNTSTRHILNTRTMFLTKKGVRIVNVSRGAVIKEKDLCDLLDNGHVYGAALDVFEKEPVAMTSRLRNHPACIFGSHNASNTLDAVNRTSLKAIELCVKLLEDI